MRHPAILAMLLISASCFAQSQAPEPTAFLTALQNMPSQIHAGTFDQQAFNAFQAQAEADENLDVAVACRLLEVDLGDSNVLVNSRAALVLNGLMHRKVNRQTDRQLVASTLLSCVDKGKDQNLQQLCVTFLVEYGTPVSSLAQFKDTAARKIADGTAYPALAVGLALAAAKGLNTNTDAVLADFFRSSSVPDGVKAKAIFILQNLPLSDGVLDAVAELLSKTKSDELKVEIIQASQKFGDRALEREHNTLLALEANLGESAGVRGAAGNGLRAAPQSSTTIPAIH